MQKVFFSKLGVRFTHVQTNPGYPYNWLFLPGGPGLGSEYFSELTSHLQVSGFIWHVDLPGDGSNREQATAQPFGSWFDAIFDATAQLNNSVLVAHSTGGMLALATARLETNLRGLVLMNSAPDSSWRKGFEEFASRNPIEGIDLLYQKYQVAPSDGLLKVITLKAKPYLFTKEGLKKDLVWLEALPFNHAACDWAEKNFDSEYTAKWTPTEIPTLILSGEEDQMLPLKVFSKKSEFQRPNVELVKISKAAHFPWIENLDDVVQAFMKFSVTLANR